MIICLPIPAAFTDPFEFSAIAWLGHALVLIVLGVGTILIETLIKMSTGGLILFGWACGPSMLTPMCALAGYRMGRWHCAYLCIVWILAPVAGWLGRDIFPWTLFLLLPTTVSVLWMVALLTGSMPWFFPFRFKEQVKEAPVV